MDENVMFYRRNNDVNGDVIVSWKGCESWLFL